MLIFFILTSLPFILFIWALIDGIKNADGHRLTECALAILPLTLIGLMWYSIIFSNFPV